MSLLSLFIVFSLTVNSVQASVDDLFNMSLEELMHVKVVGSTHTPETLSSVPASVSVYSSDEIELMGIQTLEELMNFVPGFSSARSGDSGYREIPTVRSKRSGATGKEVLILIDGQRLNSDFSGSTFVFNNQIPVGNFERVEFIRGPGSALYGSNAFMGVVNIITSKDKNDISASIGSNGSINTYLNYTYSSDDFRLSTFVTHNKTDGEIYNNLFNFSVTNPVATTKDPFKRDEIYINADYNRFNLVGSFRRTKASEFYALGNINNDVNRHDIHGGFARLTYDSTGLTFLNTKISVGYRDERSDLDFVISPNGALPNTNAPATFLTTLEGHELDLRVDNRINFDNGSILLVGGEYRHAKTQKLFASVNGFPGPNAVYFGQFLSLEKIQGSGLTAEDYRNIYGIYAQYQKDLTQNINFTAGVRYDNYSDFGTALSPRVALVYDNFSGRIFKLLYAEAFRAPAREENDLQAQGVLAGNALLKPEIAKTLEAIWIENIVNHTFTLTLFSTRVEDAISDVTNGLTGQRTVRNGTENYTGFEVELLSDIYENFFLRSSLSIVTDTEDVMFRNVSETGSIVLNWHKDKFNTNVSGYYHGDSEGDFGGTRVKIDDFFEFSANVMYKIDSYSTLFLQAKNLLDENYVTPFEGITHPDGVIGRGRRVYVGINYRF